MITAIVGFVPLRGPTHSFYIQVGDSNIFSGAVDEAICETGNKVSRAFVGTEVTIADAEGKTVGAAHTKGKGEYASEDDARGSCYWVVTIDGVKDSESYEIAATLPGGEERRLTFSRAELEGQTWALRFDVDLFD